MTSESDSSQQAQQRIKALSHECEHLKEYAHSLFMELEGLRQLEAERDQLLEQIESLREERDEFHHLYEHFKTIYAPGHFYSPYPDLSEVRKKEHEIFSLPEEVPGIDLNLDAQLQLLERFQPYYDEQPFPEEKSKDFRYFLNNGPFSYSDGLFLYCMIRHVAPKRIIEVGSGYSSCVMLDTNERYFANEIHCTFVEPYPELLLSLINDADRESIDLRATSVQEVPLSLFEELNEGDILFIDSTHVAKAGGDVNYLYFEVIPRLKPNVYIHVHDIFPGFEYPKAWVYEGRAWNEIYLLRAMLIGNPSLQVQFWNLQLEQSQPDWFREQMPLCMRGMGAGIWLKTT